MANVWTSWLTSMFTAILSDRFDREGRKRALPLAQHERLLAAEIDHRARLDAARAGVDDEVELVLEARADFLRVGERRGAAGEQQRGREHRLAELDEQRVRHRVARHAHAYGLAPPVHAAPRHLPARAPA